MYWFPFTVFFVAFAGWIAYGKKAGWSALMKYGTGFAAAFLALVMAVIVVAPDPERPVETAHETLAPSNTEPAKVSYGPGLGMSYAQLMSGMDAIFPVMEDSPLATGERRKIGQSNDKAAAVIEVVGETPDAVNRVSLLIFTTDTARNFGNAAAMTLMLHNIFPDWDGGLDWANKAVAVLAQEARKQDGIKVKEVVRGEKRLKVTLFKELGSFSFEVTHKSLED